MTRPPGVMSASVAAKIRGRVPCDDVDGVSSTIPAGQPQGLKSAGTLAPLLRYVSVPAADGSVLATTVLRPQEPSTDVTLLWRTPYGRAAHLSEAFGWARRGFRVVLQDVRGRHDSEGSFVPYRNEADDSLATLEWLSRNGIDDDVITYGASYAAHCALAPVGHLELAGVLVMVPALDHASCIRERNGAPRLYAHAQWWLEHGDTRIPRGPLLDLLAATTGQDPLSALPVTAPPSSWGVDLPGFAAAWEQTEQHPVGSALDRLRTRWSGASEQIPPLLCIGGWADSFTDDAQQLWQQWPHPSARLLISPWGHTLRPTADDRWRSAASAKIGALAASWAADVGGIRTGGSRALLTCPRTPADSRVEQIPHWNRWDGPGHQADPVGTHLFPAAGTDTSFVAEPQDPHPSRLGHVPVDDLLDRSDAAVFTSDPSQEFSVLGNPVVDLDGLRTDSAGEVDWTVRLVLQSPGAPALQIGTACIRTARESARVLLPSVYLTVPAGSCWTVQISGHQFPLYPRDPQTGQDPLVATELRSARRAVGAIRLLLPPAAAPSETDEQVTTLWNRP